MDQINYVKSQYYSGKISCWDAIKKIDKTEAETNKKRITKSELFYELGNYVIAEGYAKKVINNPVYTARANFILYKIKCLECDFISAEQYLINHCKLSKSVDPSFILSIFSYINRNEEIIVDTANYFGLSHKEKFIFEDFKKYFYEKDFDKCEEIISKLEEKNTLTDFKPLKYIISEAKQKYNNYIKEVITNDYEMLSKRYEQNDLEAIYKSLNNITKIPIKEEYTSIIYRCLMLLIERKYANVEHIIKKLPIDSIKKELIIRGNNYNKIVTEENIENSEYLILKCDYLLQKKYYGEAYDYYQLGYYQTNNPIFLYYIGKVLYKCKRYEEAKEYFLKYKNSGFAKMDKATMYLLKTYIYTDKYTKEELETIDDCYEYLKEISDLYCENFDYTLPAKYRYVLKK